MMRGKNKLFNSMSKETKLSQTTLLIQGPYHENIGLTIRKYQDIFFNIVVSSWGEESSWGGGSD